MRMRRPPMASGQILIPRGIVGQSNGGVREVITITTELDEPIATSDDSETTVVIA